MRCVQRRRRGRSRMQPACRLCPPPPNRCNGMKSACRLNAGGEQSAGNGMQAPCPPWPYAIRMQEVRTRSLGPPPNQKAQRHAGGASRACSRHACGAHCVGHRKGCSRMQSACMWGALCPSPPQCMRRPHAGGARYAAMSTAPMQSIKLSCPRKST